MPETITPPIFTAFRHGKKLVAGPLTDVALKVKELAEGDHAHDVFIFADDTGKQIDLDLRGTPAQVLKRVESTFGQAPGSSAEAVLPESAPRPGRPRLGVVAKEVTLLPKHWDWLGRQPGGASVCLRKLVEEAQRKYSERDTIRQAQDRAYSFMSALAGNEEGFEEAARALFRPSETAFDQSTKTWPADVRKHAKKLALAALQKKS